MLHFASILYMSQAIVKITEFLVLSSSMQMQVGVPYYLLGRKTL